MIVGVLVVQLRIPGNHSLKGKRGILKSMLARLRQRYNVACAEVGAQDQWQAADIGISYVSNERNHANEVLQAVLGFIESDRLDVQVIDHELELITY